MKMMDEKVHLVPVWAYTPHKRLLSSDDPFFEVSCTAVTGHLIT